MLQQLICAINSLSIKWADIQQQWSDATLTSTPPTRPFIYIAITPIHWFRPFHSLSLSEEHKEFFLPYFVPNLRSFYASLWLTPVCSHFCSTRFMGLAFSPTTCTNVPSSIILSPESYTLALPVFLNFAQPLATTFWHSKERGCIWQINILQ